MLQLLLDLFTGPDAAPRAPAPGAVDSKPNPAPAPVHPAPTAIDVVAPEPAIALPDALAPAHFAHPRASRAIALGGAQVAYEFKRGQRRTIGFSVGADGLTVSAPRWTPVHEVEAALREKERWIVTKLGEARARHQRLEASRIDWKEGATLPATA